MDAIIIAIVLLIGVLIGVSITLAITRFVDRVDTLEENVAELQDALARKRHTNSTDAGILDVMAELNRIEFNLAEVEARNNTSLRLIESARKRAGIIRRGPYAYDKDTPSTE